MQTNIVYSGPIRFAVPALLLAVALMSSACGWLQDKRDESKGIKVESLKAADGYRVNVLATGLPKARHMALGDRGTLFVGSMAGNVYALTLKGGVVTDQRTVIKGLTSPSGIAFRDGTLYVANRTSVVRFEKIEDRLDNPGAPVTVISGLPDKARHDAHAMNFGPDGKLYVAIGSPCDACEATNDEYGVIIRVNPDGSGREVVARGIRNSVGFDWNPKTKELWFTDNGADALGPDRPNDELNRVSKLGENFGFPYCHDRDISDPKLGSKHACSEFTPPALGLGAHVASLGMRFDTSAPASAPVSMIVARHGSHPPQRVAYDVVRVIVQDGQAPRMEPFLTGFRQGHEFWGRPVDVLVMRDGAVLVSDDLNGAIYRVAKDKVTVGHLSLAVLRRGQALPGFALPPRAMTADRQAGIQTH
ncbi:MAG: PQQ-dependent sugar dehydrogenase [Betaproteobacteria bacterium]